MKLNYPIKYRYAGANVFAEGGTVYESENGGNPIVHHNGGAYNSCWSEEDIATLIIDGLWIVESSGGVKLKEIVCEAPAFSPEDSNERELLVAIYKELCKIDRRMEVMD